MIAQPRRKDLRLGLQPAESSRVHHAVAITLKGVAIKVGWFGIYPAPTSLHRKPQVRQHDAGYCGGIWEDIVCASEATADLPSLMGASSLRASALFLPIMCFASERAA